MYGHLMAVSRAHIVTGREKCPSPKADGSNASIIDACDLCSNRAASKIYQWLDEGNKIHVDTIHDDPAAMWSKLKEIHLKSASNAWFNSLTDVFNIHLCKDEELIDLCMHIQETYTIETLDDELLVMAMLCALPHEDYGSFISSVLMLNNLNQDAIIEAFCMEQVQYCAAKEEAQATAAAIATAAAQTIVCYICDGPHKVHNCPDLLAACANSKREKGDNTKPKKHGNH
ncbi:hypothetical protein J132_05977 [Termitomyces sp. J132]|nr:hypothetical protein J132_05977 [Termitomyces sp. J132]